MYSELDNAFQEIQPLETFNMTDGWAATLDVIQPKMVPFNLLSPQDPTENETCVGSDGALVSCIRSHYTTCVHGP